MTDTLWPKADGQERRWSCPFLSHGVGAIIGVILLTFFAPIIAEFALKFGPPETAAVMVLTFSAMTRLGGKSALKSLVAIFLGFILACVGMDIVSGKLRMTFDTVPLMGGFHFIVAVIGLFGLGEIFLTVEEGLKMEGVKAKVTFKDIWEGPEGAGPSSKNPCHGLPDRMLAGHSARGSNPGLFYGLWFCEELGIRQSPIWERGFFRHYCTGGCGSWRWNRPLHLPMITLGIPGSPTMAVIMGGLMIMGLQPGPMLFKEHARFRLGVYRQHLGGQFPGPHPCAWPLLRPLQRSSGLNSAS